MRETCIGCPALEKKDEKDFCFYYQGWININEPCGNGFEEKPEFTQAEYEEVAFVLSDKYAKWTIDDLDRIYVEEGEWNDEVLADIRYSSEMAKEEMRNGKKSHG